MKNLLVRGMLSTLALGVLSLPSWGDKVPVTMVSKTSAVPEDGNSWSDWRSDNNHAVSVRSRREDSETVVIQIRFDAPEGACSVFWNIGSKQEKNDAYYRFRKLGEGFLGAGIVESRHHVKKSDRTVEIFISESCQSVPGFKGDQFDHASFVYKESGVTAVREKGSASGTFNTVMTAVGIAAGGVAAAEARKHGQPLPSPLPPATTSNQGNQLPSTTNYPTNQSQTVSETHAQTLPPYTAPSQTSAVSSANASIIQVNSYKQSWGAWVQMSGYPGIAARAMCIGYNQDAQKYTWLFDIESNYQGQVTVSWWFEGNGEYGNGSGAHDMNYRDLAGDWVLSVPCTERLPIRVKVTPAN